MSFKEQTSCDKKIIDNYTKGITKYNNFDRMVCLLVSSAKIGNASVIFEDLQDVILI